MTRHIRRRDARKSAAQNSGSWENFWDSGDCQLVKDNANVFRLAETFETARVFFCEKVSS